MNNLQSSNIASVAFTGILPDDHGESESLKGILVRHQNGWPRRDIDKLGFYEVDGVNHHLGLDIERERRRDAARVVFTLESHPFSNNEKTRVATRRRQESEFAQIQQLLADFEASEIEARGRFHIHWRFPPDSRTPLVSLPALTIRNSEGLLTEVSGIRFKIQREGGDQNVTVDLAEDTSLVVVWHSHPQTKRLSPHILAEAIGVGNRLVDSLVFRSG